MAESKVAGTYANLNKSDYPLWVAHTYALPFSILDIELPLSGAYSIRRPSVVSPTVSYTNASAVLFSNDIYQEVTSGWISERYKINSAMTPHTERTLLGGYRRGYFVQGAKAWLHTTDKQEAGTYLSKDTSVVTDVAEFRFRLSKERFTSWAESVRDNTTYTDSAYKADYPEMKPLPWGSDTFLGVRPIVIPITVKLKIRIL